MSKSWGGEQQNRVSCVCSLSLLYVRGVKKFCISGDEIALLREPEVHDRLLCGEECLAIQGFGYEEQMLARSSEVLAMTSVDKMELAGNAMDGVVLAVLFTAIVASGAVKVGVKAARDAAARDEHSAAAAAGSATAITSEAPAQPGALCDHMNKADVASPSSPEGQYEVDEDEADGEDQIVEGEEEELEDEEEEEADDLD
jgi:hypothetical protein